MTIGYYLSKTQASDGGIYQYSIYVLKMLLKCDEIKEIVIFYSLDQEAGFASFLQHPKVKPVLYEKNGKIYNWLKRGSEFYLTRYYLKRMSRSLPYKLYSFLNPDRHFLNRYKLDVLHIPRQHSPAYNLRYPVVVSMHDVQQYHFPEFFSPLERIYKAIRYYTSMSEASHIIVSYNHVKADLLKYFRDISAEVSVCPVPINEDWISGKPATSKEDLMAKYGIPETILLTPAATWEHKNHLAVLEALALLNKDGIRVFWVSTGNKTAFYPTLEQKIKELKLEHQVLFTGVIPDADLVGLYKMSKLVVIPTLYEAGSGPLFEAMRYNTPVICSNVTSLPDTIGNPDFVFDPLNHRQLADYISKALTDPGFTAKNIANSIERVRTFEKSDYAPAFTDAYKKAIAFHKSRHNS